MALQKIRVPVLIRGGLAQDREDVALGLGEGFVTMENLRYDRAGVLKKRKGHEAVSNEGFRGLSSLPTGQIRSLHTYRGAIVAAMGFNDPILATHTAVGWSQHGLACPLSMRRRALLRVTEKPVAAAQTVVVGPYTIVVYRVDTFLFYKQILTSTGAVLQDDRRLQDDCSQHRAFAVGDDVVVVYWNNLDNELRAFRLKPNLGSPVVQSAELTLEINPITFPFDGCAAQEAGQFYVAWVPFRTGVRVIKCSIGGLPLDAPTVVAGPLTHADIDAVSLHAVVHESSNRLWVSFARFNGGVADIRLGRWNAAPFALAGVGTVYTDPTAVATSARTVCSPGGWVGWEQIPGDDGGGAILLDAGGGSPGARVRVRELFQSRFFRRAGADWIFLGEDGSYALVRLDQGEDLPPVHTYHGAICWREAIPTPIAAPLADVCVSGTQAWRWGALVLTGIPSTASAVPAGRSGVDLVDLDYFIDQAPVNLATERANCLTFGGAMAPIFDGAQVVESGFFRPPTIRAAVPSAGGGGAIEGGDVAPGQPFVYLYRAVYEWQDARGNWHYSEPSQPVAVQIGSALPLARVDLEVTCLALTRRGDLAGFLGRRARVALFRTLKNTTGPYYRIDDPNVTTYANERNSAVVFPDDGLSDAALLATGFGQLYTTGGVLESQLAPPALALAAWQNRLWLVSGEDPRVVCYSKEILPGEAPQFHRTQLFVQIEEEATAVAAAGPVLLIFSRTRTHALSGLGPAMTGALADWRGPTVVSETIGCVDARSVVTFPGGTLFLAEKGFHLLTSPQAPPAFVGGPVQAITDEYTVCRAAAHDPENGRVLWVMARASVTAPSVIVVWDYLRSAWFAWTAGGTSDNRYPRALAVLDGATWYANNATVLRQSDTATGDGGEYFSWRLRLPWVRLQGITGFQRLWRVVVALKRSAGVKVLTILRSDDSDAADQTAEHNLAALAAEANGRLQLETHVVQQKGRSAQVELVEALTGSSLDESGTLELYGIDLEVGQKRGRNKVTADNRR
jgi:hypothetical protein